MSTEEQTPAEAEVAVEEYVGMSRFMKFMLWFGGLSYWFLAWRMSNNPDSDVLTNGLMTLFAPIAFPICAFLQLMSGYTDHSPDLTNWTVRMIWFFTLFLQLGTYWLLAKVLQLIGEWIQGFRASYIHKDSSEEPPQE